MPALADSDEAVRGELETLAGKAPVESLLIPTQIIRRWVAFINSLDKDGLPVAQRPIKRVPGYQQVSDHDQALVLDERNRSEERRVGKECVRTCRSRWSPNH